MSTRSPIPSSSPLNVTFDRHTSSSSTTTTMLADVFGNHNDGSSNSNIDMLDKDRLRVGRVKATGKVFRRDNNNNIHRLDSDKENTPSRRISSSYASNTPHPKALSAKKGISNRNNINNENIDPNVPNTPTTTSSSSSNTVYKNKIVGVSASSPLKSLTKSLKANNIGRKTPSSTGSSSEKNRESVYGVVRKPLKEKKNGANNNTNNSSRKGQGLSSSSSLSPACWDLKKTVGSCGSSSGSAVISCYDNILTECHSDVLVHDNDNDNGDDDDDDSFENLVAAKNTIATVDGESSTKIGPTNDITNSKVTKLQQSAKEKDGLIFLLKGTVNRKKQLLVSSQHEANVLNSKLRSSNEHIVALKREVDHLKGYLKAAKDDDSRKQRETISVGTSPRREDKTVTTMQYIDSSSSDKCTNTSFAEDGKDLDGLSTQLAIQRRYNDRLEDQMRSLVESHFAANLVLAEQDIADKFFRKVLVGTGTVVGAASSFDHLVNHQISKVESQHQQQQQQQQHTLREGDGRNVASSSKSTAASSSPKLLKELFAGLETLATASVNNMQSLPLYSNVSNLNSSDDEDEEEEEEETVFDTAPDYGRDDMYSDLSDDNSLEEVFASLNDVESFANESKTIKTTAAVIAAKASSAAPCISTKNESGVKGVKGSLTIAPNQLQQPSLSILSPSSFREHMLQIRQENDNIRDDILRFRSTLRQLREENLTVMQKRTTYAPPSSARM